MRAGKLDRKITIQRSIETKDGPRVVTTWTEFATVRAELVKWSASEFSTGYGEAEAGTLVFRIRYLDGITTADRVTYDGIAYGIKEITEIGRRRGLELRAVVTR